MAEPIIVPGEIADWVPLSTRQTERAMVGHHVACLHTMVGYLISTDQMWRPDGYVGIESHFGVGGKWGPDVGLGLDGRIFQWQDLRYQSDANLDGNPTVISIETADNGREPIQPWSDKQLTSIVNLLDWLCRPDAHKQCPPSWLCHQIGIPRQLIPDTKPGRRGIGYHRQGIVGNYPDGLAPGGVRWSNATGKTCPTDVRIHQIKSIIIPALNVRNEEDDMPHFTVINGPGKPPRVFVEGSLVGFPNANELSEYMRPWVRAGFTRKDVTFTEADDWQRYMDGYLRVDPVARKVNEILEIEGRQDLRLIDIQNHLGTVEEKLDEAIPLAEESAPDGE